MVGPMPPAPARPPSNANARLRTVRRPQHQRHFHHQWIPDETPIGLAVNVDQLLLLAKATRNEARGFFRPKALSKNDFASMHRYAAIHGRTS